MKSIRLRHLNGLKARNLALPSDISLLNIQWFFTLKSLHSDSLGAFYKSAILQQCTLNPKWEDIDLVSCNISELSSKVFVIAVYYVYNNQNYMILEWEVHLDALICVGNQLPFFNNSSSPLQNALVFLFGQNYYITEDIIPHFLYKFSQPTPTLSSLEELFEDSSLINQPQGSQRRCYTFQSLRRLLTGARALHQYSKRAAATVDSCHGDTAAEQQRHALQQQAAKLSERRAVVALLSGEVDRLEQQRAAAEQRLGAARKSREAARRSVELCNEEITKCERLKLDGEQRRISICSELEQAARGLNLRRKQLAIELTDIISVTEHPRLPDDPQRLLYIAGVHLPRTELLLQHSSDTSQASVAAALGHTCLLVDRLSHLLDVPLRYPLYPCGSKSRVQDPLHVELPDDKRIFPLYSRSQEKMFFKYGCFLLNKDIQQLRWGCGLDTTDLRGTLANLLDLLIRKFKSSSSIMMAPPVAPAPSASPTPEPIMEDVVLPSASFRPAETSQA